LETLGFRGNFKPPGGFSGFKKGNPISPGGAHFKKAQKKIGFLKKPKKNFGRKKLLYGGLNSKNLGWAN